MIWKYVNRDIIGAASLRLYATIGTRVFILKNMTDLLLVQDQDGNTFYCKPKDLSNEPIQNIQTKTLAKKTRR